MRAQLARMEQAVELDAREVLRGRAARTRAARYSWTCQGLSERAAPFGASVSTFGVETNTAPARADERAEVLEHGAGVLRGARSSAGTRPRRPARRTSRPGRARSAGSAARSAAARARGPRGWRRRRPRSRRSARARPSHSPRRRPCRSRAGRLHARGDPFVDDEVAAEPVVLLGHVGQRALAGQRQRRHARRLIALLETSELARQRASSATE